LRKKEKDKLPEPKILKNLQSLRGFNDILPSEQPYWQFVYEKLSLVVKKYNFQRIDTPIVEPTGLFKRSIGDATDIVEKEMFSFDGLGGDAMSLRPEATASIARAHIEHGMLNWPQPVKLYYVGPMFRYDRPQTGRYRQFNQFGFEMLGEAGPAADAEILLMTYRFFQSLGLEVTFDINSIGCVSCRAEYKKLLLNFYRPKKSKLCSDCQKRFGKNPLRLLDCKVPSCIVEREDMPQIVDSLDEECQAHFMRVLECLDDLGIPYMLNAQLVRGLDYYNRTAFEVFLNVDEKEEKGKDIPGRIALGGGGRYDGLLEQLGGRPTPAVGFAGGIERITESLKAKGIILPSSPKPMILLAQIGAQAKVKAMKLFETLYDAGFSITENFVKDSLKAQLELADRLGCHFVIILGQKEVLDNTILIRDMEAGIQEVIDVNKIVHELQKKLEAKTL
jgi:histidyl-tRNA synthetase